MSRESSPQPNLTPEDFEVGEDVTTEFTIGPNPGIQLAVRLSLEEASLLQAIARKEGKSLTETAREALLATIAAGALPTSPRT